MANQRVLDLLQTCESFLGSTLEGVPNGVQETEGSCFLLGVRHYARLVGGDGAEGNTGGPITERCTGRYPGRGKSISQRLIDNCVSESRAFEPRLARPAPRAGMWGRAIRMPSARVAYAPRLQAGRWNNLCVWQIRCKLPECGVLKVAD